MEAQGGTGRHREAQGGTGRHREAHMGQGLGGPRGDGSGDQGASIGKNGLLKQVLGKALRGRRA